MAAAITELRPITDYPGMSWQALLAEWNKINSLERHLPDYPTRKALLGLLLANIQDTADIQAYQQKIAARNARIQQLTGGGV